MKKKSYKFIFSLLIILLVPVIITGCSGFGTSDPTTGPTDHSLRINEIEYNFSGYENYEKPQVEPEAGKSHTYEKNSIAYLDVFPTEDIIFYDWIGRDGEDVEPDNGQYRIYMDSDKTITPLFGLAPEDGKALVQGNIEINHNFPYSVLEDESFYETPTSSSMAASTDKFTSQSFDFAEEDISELIIRFEDFIDNENINEILADLNFEKIGQIPELNSILVRIPDMAIDNAIKLAEEIQGIRYAEPNHKVRALNSYNNEYKEHLSIPDDQYFNKQWHYPLIRLPQAWSSYENSSSDSIRIAVLDTGVPYNKEDDVITHDDLNNIDTEYGKHFFEKEDDGNNDDIIKDYDDNINDDSENDIKGHGTHVTGVINAKTNNEIGVAGIFNKADILPVKVLNEDGIGTDWTISKGLLYAAGLSDDPENPYEDINIINLSFGGGSQLSLTEDALNKIDDNTDILVVAASGNNDSDLFYPAKYETVISVGSVSLENNFPERSSFSNYGPDLDFVSPGVDIYSTLSEYKYGTMEGTSMATPHVTGLIGLMLSNDVNPGDVEDILRRTSMKINDGRSYHDEETGYGLINAYWAINDVQEIKIILGEKDILEDSDDSIKVSNNKIVNEKTIPLEEFYNTDNDKFDFYFNGVEPEEEYKLIGLIDVSNNSNGNYIKIEPGDYFFTEELNLQADNHYEYKVELEEYDGN